MKPFESLYIRTPFARRRPVKQFSIYEQLLRRNVERFRAGLVVKAHILVYHSTLRWRLVKEKKRTFKSLYIRGTVRTTPFARRRPVKQVESL